MSRVQSLVQVVILPLPSDSLGVRLMDGWMDVTHLKLFYSPIWIYFSIYLMYCQIIICSICQPKETKTIKAKLSCFFFYILTETTC